MTIIGINGSPRKNWNTATLLTHALEGAASQGADYKDIYDKGFRNTVSSSSVRWRSSTPIAFAFFWQALHKPVFWLYDGTDG